MPISIPLPKPGSVVSGTATLDTLISRVIDVMIAVGFLYFMFQIIFAGFGMLSSEGDKGKIEMARNRMSQSVIGLIIITSAYTLTGLMLKILGLPIQLSIVNLFP